jgi:site-specific recombinase XerD
MLNKTAVLEEGLKINHFFVQDIRKDRESSSQNKEIYDKFMNWLRIAHKPATVESYHWALKPLFDWLYGANLEITTLTSEDITNYSLYLKDKRELKTSTLFHYLIALRSLWRWLFRSGYVFMDEKIIEIPKDLDKESYPYVLLPEYEKMMKTFEEFQPEQLRNKTILAFLYYTGVRLGELLAIDVDQIDFKNKKAKIKTYKRHNHCREVYWGEELNNLLQRWLPIRQSIADHFHTSSSALFVAMATSPNSGDRMGRHQVQRMIRTARSKAKIKRHITAHSFRHGFGHRAVENNVNPRYLQVMLGHAKLETTMIYMGVANEEVKNVYRTVMI